MVDLTKAQVIAQLFDTVPGGTGEGSTPNALAISPDGRRLSIAEADNNAVALFELSGESAGISSGASAADRLIGRIPVEWYPTALLVQHDTLLVANAKGRRTGPNPLGPEPGIRSRDPRGYTLDQTSGTLSLIPLRGSRRARAHQALGTRGARQRVGSPSFRVGRGLRSNT